MKWTLNSPPPASELDVQSIMGKNTLHVPVQSSLPVVESPEEDAGVPVKDGIPVVIFKLLRLFEIVVLYCDQSTTVREVEGAGVVGVILDLEVGLHAARSCGSVVEMSLKADISTLLSRLSARTCCYGPLVAIAAFSSSMA